MPDTDLQAPTDEKRPWQALSNLVESGASGEELHDYIDDLSPGDTALAISRLPQDTLVSIVGNLTAEQAAELVDDLPDEQAADLLEIISPSDAAAIVDELPSDSQADVLADVDSDDAEQILGHLEDESATRIRTFLDYPEDTAGGIMISEYLSYQEHCTVGDVLDDLRAHSEEYSDYEVGYTYITDAPGKLIGVLRQRDLLFAQRHTPVASLMLKNPTSVPVDTSLQHLIDFFDDHDFIGVPVVAPSGSLVGVIRKAAVHEAAEERSSKAFLNFSGIIGGEELRSMPLGSRCLRRLAFLAPNIILNLVAVTVIARNEATLQQVIALAIFLPIVSDMSGCSGNQAVAVSIRELTLGLLRPNEFLRIVFKEGAVGIVNGIVLGTALGLIAAFWKGPAALGLVIGGALALNTVVSVLLGGCVPLLLRLFKIDPALASGPILTTVTDMCGFFLVLTLASNAMAYLV